jgi:hypothetical protein
MFSSDSTGAINVDQNNNGIITSPNYPNPAGSAVNKVSLSSSYSSKVIRIYITDLDLEDSLEYIEYYSKLEKNWF